MPTDWKTAYDAAMRTTDPAQVIDACDQARGLIHTRDFELLREGLNTHDEKREELDEALCSLVAHEYRILPLRDRRN